MVEHTHHSEHSAHHHPLNPWIIGGIGLVSAVTLAPYMLPLLGVGPNMAQAGHSFMSAVSTPVAEGAIAGSGQGLALGIHQAIGSIPFVGDALTSTKLMTLPGGLQIASGALTTALAAGVIGIGGMLLANWLEKRETGNEKIQWSHIIRIASITTSILISLPGLLTGISIGIGFLGFIAGKGFDWLNGMGATLGSIPIQHADANATASGIGGLISLIPHLFTCGVASLPILGTLLVGQKAKPSVTPEVSATTQQLPDGSRQLSIALRDRQTGAALTPKHIQTTHTQKLHTMVVNQSLTDYHHLHPEFNLTTKQWEAHFTPRSNEAYRAWHEFTLCGEKTPIQHKTDFQGESKIRNIDPVITHQNQAQSGNVMINSIGNAPLRAGAENILNIDIRDTSGKPITHFNPIMGADAHLVGFSKDGASMIHCHPMARNGNMLQFHVAPKHEGFTKFFLQLHPKDGTATTIAFGQYIAPSEHYAQRYAERTMQQKSTTHHPVLAFG